MTWVDNLYAFSTDPHKAIATLEAIEGNLKNDWGVKFKPSSLMIMQPRGARLCDDLGERWIRVHTLPVLGHLVSDNASLHADWNALKKSLWRAFWANAGSASIRHTDSPLKMRLIDRAVTCIAAYRWSRWAPQRQLAKDIDRVQAKMYIIVKNLRPRPGEDLIAWNRRRWKHAAKDVKSQGSWSSRWFNRSLRWDEHIERHPEFIVSPLRVWRGSDWLVERRQELLPALPAIFSAGSYSRSSFAGRTGTRASSGCVHKRWHDGIDYAKQLGESPTPFLSVIGLQRLLDAG